MQQRCLSAGVYAFVLVFLCSHPTEICDIAFSVYGALNIFKFDVLSQSRGFNEILRIVSVYIIIFGDGRYRSINKALSYVFQKMNSHDRFLHA